MLHVPHLLRHHALGFKFPLLGPGLLRGAHGGHHALLAGVALLHHRLRDFKFLPALLKHHVFFDERLGHLFRRNGFSFKLLLLLLHHGRVCVHHCCVTLGLRGHTTKGVRMPSRRCASQVPCACKSYLCLCILRRSFHALVPLRQHGSKFPKPSRFKIVEPFFLGVHTQMHRCTGAQVHR